MADERCVHELVPGHCAECKPPPSGLTRRVVVTRGGSGVGAVGRRTVPPRVVDPWPVRLPSEPDAMAA